MTSPRLHKIFIHWPGRLYRVLLSLYPLDFRREYGADMARVFDDRCREVARKNGFRGVLRFSALVGTDLLKTVLEERTFSMRMPSIRALRAVLLIAVAANVAILLFGVKPTATREVLAALGVPFALLTMYGILVVWATTNLDSAGEIALRQATMAGLISAGVLIAWTTPGDLGVRIAQPADMIAGSAVLLTIFAVWCLAGYRAARGGDAGSGLKAGCWSGVVCALAKISFTFLLVCFLIPRLAAGRDGASAGV